MNKVWTHVKSPKIDDSSILPTYPTTLRKLLISRGLTTDEAVERFINPDYERDLTDPYLMKDMDRAIERIILAIAKDEKIVIFGDYDADGVPASALLAEFFRSINFHNFSVYIPHRHNEQYGLSISAIEKFAEEGCQLIITVDCGITAVKEVVRATELGLEVIITDHHMAPIELPRAYAILNPKQRDCDYPDKMLSGTGVAFKLVTALAKHEAIKYEPGQEKWLLDLVAIATISDMVPLVGENRALAYYGLKVLNKTRRLGLLQLFALLKLKRENVTEDDISFMIGPRLNSAGRMAHASQAYSLLTTEDESEATEIARQLEAQNKERRRIVEDILKRVAAIFQSSDLPTVVVCGETDWPIGVLGLAAARLVEKYNRPFFVWGENGNGELKGSCRSDGHINVVDLMAGVSSICPLLDFGGHASAGGFSITKENIKKLPQALLEVYDQLEKNHIKQEILVDDTLSLDDISSSFYEKISRLSPFGIGNPKPVFLFENIIITEVKRFGLIGNHLELTLSKTDGEPVKAIAFFACTGDGEKINPLTSHMFGDFPLSPGRSLNILAHIEKSNFGWQKELRLRIVDLAEIA